MMLTSIKMVEWVGANNLDKQSFQYFDGLINKVFVDSNKGFFKPNFQKWQTIREDFEQPRILNPEICGELCLKKMETLLVEYPDFNTVQNFTEPAMVGYCQNIQIINDNYENNYSHSLCVNISDIIPYFHIHVLELKRKKNNFSKWDGLPFRRKELEITDYSSLLQKIKIFLSQDLGLMEFPEVLVNKVLPSINTENIDLGDFTYYNAFFAETFDTR